MKAEIKTRLLERLRDPKQEKCNGELRKGDSMCVWGILCDLFDPQGWKCEAYTTPTTSSGFVIPLEVSKWAGIGAAEANQIVHLSDASPDWDKLITYLEAPGAHRV